MLRESGPVPRRADTYTLRCHRCIASEGNALLPLGHCSAARGFVEDDDENTRAVRVLIRKQVMQLSVYCALLLLVAIEVSDSHLWMRTFCKRLDLLLFGPLCFLFF